MRRRVRPRWLALGGAGLAVVVVALTVWGGGSHPPASARGPVAAALVEAGDLGEVADAGALRAKVEPRLRPGAATTRAGGHRPPSRCEATGRALQPGTEVLVYVASARFAGTAAEILGFSPAAGSPRAARGRQAPVRVYVLAADRCRLLSFQSYAP